MIGWISVANAADGHLDAIVGLRTQPDAALEQPTLWEPDVEPAGLVAVVGSGSVTAGEVWGGLDGSAWAYFPESEADLVALGPKAGVGADFGPVRMELAGRYDGQWYLRSRDSTNLRADALGRLDLDLGAVTPELSVEGVDRRYLFQPRWSFTTGEADLGVRLEPAKPYWARASVGGQVNGSGGGEADLEAAGTQVRVALRVGWSARHWDLWGGYQFIDALRGEADDVERSQFSPLGEYLEDADALSGGGFVQHRAELGGTVQAGPWTVRASGLARFRDAAGPTSFDRTVHAQVDLERSLVQPLSGLLTAGVSEVRAIAGPHYTDLYVWTGVSWRP